MSDFTEQDITAEAIEVSETLCQLLSDKLPATQRSLMVAIQGLAIAAGAIIAQTMKQSDNPLKIRRLLINFLVAHVKKVANMPPESAAKH